MADLLHQQNPLRLLIADDHTIFLEALQTMLNAQQDMQVAATVSQLEDVPAAVRQHRPDVVIMDIRFNQKDSLPFFQELRQASPKTQLLTLTMFNREGYAHNARRAGSTGFLGKDASSQELLTAIRALANGKTHFSENTEPDIDDASLDSLSPREMELFRLIGEGLSRTEIAQMLAISPKTVEAHQEKLKNKLNATTTRDLARRARAWADRQHR